MKLTKEEINKAQFGPRVLRDPASKEYAIQTLYALKKFLNSLQCDQERIDKELERIDQHEHWLILGYKSKDEMFTSELDELSEIGKSQAQRLGILANKKPLGEHGNQSGKNNSRNKDRVYIINSVSKGGTKATYLSKRIARDFPDINRRQIAGEFKSVRAAAIAAGIVKPTWQITQDAEGVYKAYSKLSATEQHQFKEML